MSSHCHVARVLADVRSDIDAFLDPKLLATASRKAALRNSPSRTVETQAAPMLTPPPAADGGSEEMRRLELARAKAEAQRDTAETRATRDAAELAAVRRERDDAAKEAREASRQMVELEGKLAAALSSVDRLRRDGTELQERLEAELSSQRHAALEAGEGAAAASDVSRGVVDDAGVDAASQTAADSSALKERVAELEAETAVLRRLLEEDGVARATEKELVAELGQRHLECEEELRNAKGQREQIIALRQRLFEAEREEGALRAAVGARDVALKEADKAAHGSAIVRRDLEAFSKATATIVSESRAALGVDMAPADTATMVDEVSASASPLDLTLAWARCQAELGSLRRQRLELQRDLDSSRAAAQEAKAETDRLRTEASLLRAQETAARNEARRASDEATALATRVEVLRTAVSQLSNGGPPSEGVTIGGATETVGLEEAMRRARDADALAKASSNALEQSQRELERLRADASGFRQAEARVLELERSNSDLQEKLAALQSRTPGLRHAHEAEGVEGPDAELKILHYLRRPHDKVSSVDDKGGAGTTTAAVDLERAQALRQLDRFKRATKKYVMEFREGIYNLLGWKVEMKEEAGTYHWHLSSSLADGRELVFQLRPAGDGRPAEFDLLRSPWGLQLQEDRQAMAFLEVYRSIPGFLAHLTAELAAQKTIQG